jgi:murein DD-endopeptidase MepM/ murein hydrolase activator NlpD
MRRAGFIMSLSKLLVLLPGAVLACAQAHPPGAPVSSPSPAAPDRARDVAQMKDLALARINAHDGAGLWALYDRSMQVELPLAATEKFVDRMLAERGALRTATRVPGESATDHGTFRVEAERGEWRVEINLDADGRISGFLVGNPPPPAPPPPPVVQSDIPLGLPVRGDWVVAWGGNTKESNHHLGAGDQRRAADLLVEDASGAKHKGDGRANSDYFAYGREIVAVADGTVITVVDGVPENLPGAMAAYAIKGNYVVIRHGPKLFSLYAHLQPGRIRVKPGDAVTRGAVLGLCGNSGHSSEPHLHFQLQDGADDNTSWGVEPVFDRVVVTRDGNTQTKGGYTLWKGDRIRAGEGPAPTP